ncbi:hypothetical protein GCM10011529_02190 [Polymorphobacter glacialis]|uniref:DUF3047 domain-containing protein n=1 Tax=Sandarakinorhabdus glacialis TaxID=1614636 RepID=A0A916ZJ13_9SPHN|nr:hypothetical protein [Polymorphobacter glacialis]GGD99622.1 hypothetical protein GCM10011529_02190 [Polymorphobacter glacialis]
MVVSALIALAAPFAAAPATAPAPIPAPLGYTDLADLTLAAPVIVRANITRAERIPDSQSPGIAPGRARLLVTAAVDAALVAPGSVPPALTWLWDTPLDARGKAPKPKGRRILAWVASPAADGKTRLVSTIAQQDWSQPLEDRVRAIAVEARSGAVPVITGVSNGFRADGTIPGESESQFFLSAADGNPLTLVVTAAPGQPRRIAVARGDVIDESATSVRPDTLLRYRLACTLPDALPAKAGGGDPALAADWAAAIASLGPCGRTR